MSRIGMDFFLGLAGDYDDTLIMVPVDRDQSGVCLTFSFLPLIILHRPLMGLRHHLLLFIKP